VTRARSNEDRRVVNIRLTDRGRSIADEITVDPMAVFREAVESLSPDEIRELGRTLAKVAKKMQGGAPAARRRKVMAAAE
jgi:DNA-binding MarR family transcriptional regulator